MNNLVQLAQLQPNQWWVLKNDRLYCASKKSWLGRKLLWLKGETFEIDKIFYALSDQIKSTKSPGIDDLRRIQEKAAVIFLKQSKPVDDSYTEFLKNVNDIKEKKLILKPFNISISSLEDCETRLSWETRRAKLLDELEKIPISERIHWLVQQGCLEAMEYLLNQENSSSSFLKEAIKKLISQGWAIDSVNDQEETLLLIAIKARHLDLDFIRFLLENEATIQTDNLSDQNALHLALDRSEINPDLIKLLIAAGVDVNSRNAQLLSPLHLAVNHPTPNLEVIKALIDKGALTDQVNNELLTPCFYALTNPFVEPKIAALFQSIKKPDWTPLHALIVDNKCTPEKIKDLIALGADVNAVDQYGRTPLHWAAASESSQKNLISCLLDHGADLSKKDSIGRIPASYALSNFKPNLEVIELFLNKEVLLNTIEDDFWTLASRAASNKNPSVIQLLIDRKEDLSARSSQGVTPLMWATVNSNLEVLNLLLDYIPEQTITVKDQGSMLKLAALSPNIKKIQTLVDHGFDIRHKYSEGHYLIHWMCWQPAHLNSIRYLLEMGVDVNVKDNSGFTPLHYAIFSNTPYPDLIKMLIAYGADVNAKNNKGQNPFHALAQKVYFPKMNRIADLLISNGAKIDKKDDYGVTPSIEAAFRASPLNVNSNFIQFLLDKGAKVDKDLNGISCCELILQKNLPIQLSSSKMKDILNEKLKIKLLANNFNIGGKSVIIRFPDTYTLQMKREGHDPGVGIQELVRLFGLFSQTMKEDLSGFYELVKDSYLNTFSNEKDQLAHFKSGAPMNFVAAWGGIKTSWWKKLFYDTEGHGIGISFFDDYLIVSNRGLGRMPISSVFYKINRNAVSMSKEILQKISREIPILHKKEGIKFMYKELPKALGYDRQKKDLLSYFLNTKFTQKNQRIGNCWWVSPKASLLALMGIHEANKVLKNRSPTEISKLLDFSPIKNFRTDLELERTLLQNHKRVRSIYKKFTAFCRLQVLKEYLERPVDSILRDHNLIKEITEKLSEEKWKNYFASKDCAFTREDVDGWLREYREKYGLDERFEPNFYHTFQGLFSKLKNPKFLDQSPDLASLQTVPQR